MLKRLVLIAGLWLGAGSAFAAGTVLVYGDSLSAAYGLAQKDGWAALLDDRLRQAKLDYSVVNASISGETSAGGASRIDDVLARSKPAVVVITLGSNDGLRGLPVTQMKTNLAKIIQASQKAKAKVLVVGSRMPPNYGPQYTRAFSEAFSELAREYRTGYVPFLLDGIADKQDLFQPDNLHPTAAAQPIIMNNVWKGLEPLLKR
jgi:acyl-CoA thioesterase-1